MTDPETRAAIAAELFNKAWELLEDDTRGTEGEAVLLGAALGSWYLWHEVGSEENRAIADWQVARVFATIGDAELARRYGYRSLERCEAHNMRPFLKGYAHEAIARAEALAGRPPVARRHIAAATALAGRIVDDDERGLLDADLAEVERQLGGTR